MALNKKDVAMLRKLKVKFEVAPKGYNLSAPSCPFISDVERVVGVRSRGEEVSHVFIYNVVLLTKIPILFSGFVRIEVERLVD